MDESFEINANINVSNTSLVRRSIIVSVVCIPFSVPWKLWMGLSEFAQQFLKTILVLSETDVRRRVGVLIIEKHT